tara:strand:+ start:309 stop:1499 length:1191 start_codon:yes stop_codon:yes gene_type:complete
MKIRPIILCGGAGTRLWPGQKNYQAKQFIDFGGWTLIGKTLDRIKHKTFDYPIISTNLKYLKYVKKALRLSKIGSYKIILEPSKKNTAPAILSAALIDDIPLQQPLMYFTADHLIENPNKLIKSITKHKVLLNDKKIFIFGIKPTLPSSEYGYFLTKKNNKVNKFIEKPSKQKAKTIIKKKGYWNSGMFFMSKNSVINNFKKFQPSIYKNCVNSYEKSIYKNKIFYLNKNAFNKINSKSFDYAILEKAKNIYGIKLDIQWSDLGSWKEICKMYQKNKKKYFNKKNVFHRPWGKYVNLFNGKGFLIKELFVKPKGILSLQKHFHRSEHWVVTQGTPKITLNNKKFIKRVNENIYIPLGAIHRIENPYTKPVKIIEAQIGSILKESDIVRYKDVYNRI